MSDTNSAPLYTINVGTPGEFTNDLNSDISGQVNEEISKAPVGDAIKIVFNPGDYSLSSPILLPSNTSVTGDDAVLSYLPRLDGNTNFALLANRDAYMIGLTNYVTMPDGSLQEISYNPSATPSMPNGTPSIVDSNISVQGLTFDLGTAHIFGTWFTNTTNIDVQNNTYVGGTDGNAFVNVVNGVVAQNIGVGQNNAAYDNWNGPTNITVEGNETYMSGTSTSGWSVLMNSTPSGDPANPGNARNDGIIENQLASGMPSAFAIYATALLPYGFTTESNITVQGNTFSLMDVANQIALYAASPMFYMSILDNVVSGLSSDTGPYSTFDLVENGSGGANITAWNTIKGNLITGVNGTPKIPEVVNDGWEPTTVDNGVLDASAPGSTTFESTSFGSIDTLAGNITSSGSNLNGGLPVPVLDVAAPPAVFSSSGEIIAVPNLTIDDPTSNDELDVTLTTQFGSLSLSYPVSEATTTTINGEQAVIVSGDLDQVNAVLSTIDFQSNSQGWDDSIEVNVTNASGSSASAYIPVFVSSSQIAEQISTLSSADLSSMGINVSKNGSNLTGDALIAPSGNNTILLGGSISLVFLGQGQDTIEGGNRPSYIATGDAIAAINLSGGGNATIAAGIGDLSVNASTGSDLIEAGGGATSVYAGSGFDTILGGLGSLNVVGGTGSLVVETLPENGGDMSVTLGPSGGLVFALSGNDTIKSQSGAPDVIYSGLGSDIIMSGGDDMIYTGSGDTTINASSGGTDSIVGGSGRMTFLGGIGTTFIDPAEETAISAGGGNLTVGTTGNFIMTIWAISNSTRKITLPDLSSGVILMGFGSDPIVGQTISQSNDIIQLSDKTELIITDPAGAVASVIAAGQLALNGEPTSVVPYNMFDFKNPSV